MWQAHSINVSYESRKKVNRFFWQQFLSGLIESGDVVPLDEVELQTKLSKRRSKDANEKPSEIKQKPKSVDRRATFITGAIEEMHK